MWIVTSACQLKPVFLSRARCSDGELVFEVGRRLTLSFILAHTSLVSLIRVEVSQS